MTDALLYVHRSAEGKLTIQLKPQPSDDLPDTSTYYRVSPIFRVWPDLAGEVNFSAEVVFAFYILDSAYRVISEIGARLPRVKPFLWFSHGLASVIVISPEPSLIWEVDELVSRHQIASEKWRVVDGALIEDPILSFPDPPVVTSADFSITDYSSLPEDVCTIVREFNHSLNKAVWLSRLFMPRELSTYRRLLQAVNDIIETLVRYHGTGLVETSDDAGNTSQTGNGDHLARRKAIHQLQDRLVQINSALSYLMSQAFAGAVPIMQRECLIRNYSLLGVGTAVAGISALARRVELIFESTPIDLVIQHAFRGRSKLEGWLTPGTYDVREWDQPQFGVDEYLNEVPQPPHIPKLMYLSGRLGFREAEFSVSSALQVLSAANSIGWSLMTLTHELLHGHVRELMSAILIRPSEASTVNDFQKLVEDYHREKDGLSEREIDRFDSLRFIILHYCEQVASFGSLSYSSRFRPKNGKLLAPKLDLDAESLRELLELEYRNISEIMVHVLDFYYFYNAEPENYLPFVWESWSKVPSVLKNIQHYLLRSIVTIAAKLNGTRHERFTAAVSIVREQIKIAGERNPTNEVLREATAVLNNAATVAEMRLPFYPSLLIGDLTAKILRARSLHVSLLGDDPNLDVGPTGFRYAIRPATFVDDQVISPTAFLLGVLHEALRVPELEGSQRESAWVYLALASSTSLRGGGPDVR
ncbi:MAG: hypothetical protein ACJ8GN_00955 [Longimicrobiaceae bacterium]